MSFGASLFSQIETATITPIKTKRKFKDGSLYGMWGYTQATYSKSTIHFKDNSNTKIKQ